MTINNETFTITTRGFDDVIDITKKINNIVLSSNIKEGLINIFIASSTSAILIIEQEPGITEDIKNFISFVFPVNKVYQHDAEWYKGNGYSHLRASLFQKNISIPIANGVLALDKYQQIVMLDFNSEPDTKKIITTIISEKA